MKDAQEENVCSLLVSPPFALPHPSHTYTPTQTVWESAKFTTSLLLLLFLIFVVVSRLCCLCSYETSPGAPKSCTGDSDFLFGSLSPRVGVTCGRAWKTGLA